MGRSLPVFALALLFLGCEAAAPGAARGASGSSGGTGTELPPDQAPASALHRSSRREVENALVDVLGLSGLAEKYLPADLRTPFDTDASSKDASHLCVQGLESLARDAGSRLAADRSRLASLAGCSPSSVDDASCFEALARGLGLRLWRRPLDAREVEPLVASALSIAREQNDVAPALRLLVATLLQAPAFVYRTELGAEAGMQRKLDNFELASKLAQWLWGSVPDTALLDRAAGSELSSSELAELADAMLKNPRADEQILTFHRQWLGFEELRVPAELAPSMLEETRALLRNVLVLERGPWSELLTSRVTYVDPLLARHYGLPSPPNGGFDWVTYTRPDQVGLLAHGSVASLAARFMDDTSPTLRGKYFATRLLCWTVPPPPPNVNPDLPPEGVLSSCKVDAYRRHRDASDTCAGCHVLMDPIGFGLERIDALGRYRTEEKDKAGCVISGDGELAGIGTFNGAKGLVDLVLASHELQSCAVRQYLRFSRGRLEKPEDEPLIARLTAAFVDSGERFRTLVLAAVADPSFRYRKEEP